MMISRSCGLIIRTSPKLGTIHEQMAARRFVARPDGTGD
jgi:hypothetical protein